MRKYLLFIATVISFSTFVQAEENINECINDIYFANGINTSKKDAKIQLDDMIEPQVSKDVFNSNEEKMTQTVTFKLAYNNTMGIAFDLLEAYGQKKAEHGTFWWTLGTFYDVFGGIAKQGLQELTSEGLEALIVETLKKTASQFIVDPLINEAGLTDLAKLMKDLRSGVSPSNVWQTLVDSAAALENYDATKQLGSYKNSIKLGHSAIVIAHSQGNLFTNVVYEKIATSSEDKWMTKYFYMVGVASPAGVGTGPKGIEIVTFDNDPISSIPDSIGTPITNPMRYIVWDSEDNSRTSPCLNGFYPDGTVVSPCELGLDSGHPWFAFDNDKIDFHLFTYYMNTEIAKTKIMDFVDISLKAHGEAKSQWIQKEETNKNTCEHKITVKHKEDPSIEMPLEVYPFNTSKKLYQVNGEYVKASCGGKNILPTWDGKKDNECLMIDNVEEEKIGKLLPEIIYTTSGGLMVAGVAGGYPESNGFYYWHVHDGYIFDHWQYGSGVKMNFGTQSGCSGTLGMANKQYTTAEQYALKIMNINVEKLKLRFPNKVIDIQIYKGQPNCWSSCTTEPSDPPSAQCTGVVGWVVQVYD